MSAQNVLWKKAVRALANLEPHKTCTQAVQELEIMTVVSLDRDLWPDSLENGKEVSSSEAALSTTNLPVQQSDISQSNELQQRPTINQTSTESNPIPSLINRTPVSGPIILGLKGKDLDNFSADVHMVNNRNSEGQKVSLQISGINAKNTLVGTNDQKGNVLDENLSYQSNKDVSSQPQPSQQTGPQPLHNQPVEQKPLHNQPKGPQSLRNQPKGPQPLNNQPKGPQPLHRHPTGPQPLHNQPMGRQPLINQPMEPQLLRSQPVGPQPLHGQPIGPQPLHNQPVGPQPQFVPAHLQEVQAPPYQEVPFGPQPLFIPPPLMYGQPFMDTPLQFGPNPPIFVSQNPCDFGPVGMDMPPMDAQIEMMKQPLSGIGQMPNKTTPLSANQTQISVPSVTITVPNNPQKSDLREELSKKRQAENRKISSNRVVYDVTTEKSVINRDDNDSDSWSRKVFVAEPGSAAKQEEQRRDSVGQAAAGPQDKTQDLREKLRHKDPMRETKASGEPTPRRNSPQRNFHNRMRKGSPEQSYKGGNDRRRRSPHFDQQKMSPDRNRSREVSRERWRSREQSPEKRIVRRRESSHERRVFHDPTRNTGDDCHSNTNDRFRSKSRSRSFSPRRRERSPSPTVIYRDLWDNIPARHSESIFMYKYVKQNSTTESDPYALLRATRSLLFNVDFDFIKEQTAIDEWYVSVELVTDDANIHPLVGEGMARTEQEASRRAAHHAVDTIQKACRVIEPNQRYFCEGGVPDFIARKSPMKTSLYEIIQNLDPGTPLARYTVEMMFKMFVSSDLEDIFFLATDFSYLERVLVIEMATQMNLWWRLFGPRHPSARPDDVVSTQHVCVFKQKSALQLARELIAKGGCTEKYSLVDPREYRLTRPRFSREFSRDLR